VALEDLAGSQVEIATEHQAVLKQQQAFGYTAEDVRILMAPMAVEANEAVGSMGNDAALAVLSQRPQLLFNYFRQLFAQVTNPPVDGIREEIIMTMDTTIGGEGNLLEPVAASCRQIKLKSPIIAQRRTRKS
jgi:Glutamate synthase central domain.